MSKMDASPRLDPGLSQALQCDEGEIGCVSELAAVLGLEVQEEPDRGADELAELAELTQAEPDASWADVGADTYET